MSWRERWTKIASSPIDLLTALPGTTRWLAVGRGAIVRGDLASPDVVDTVASAADPMLPTGILGIGPDLVLVTLATRAALYDLGAEEIAVRPLAKLQGAPGFRTVLRAGAGVVFLACGPRLARFDPEPTIFLEPETSAGALAAYGSRFTAVAPLPGAAAIVVGRGDGTVEVRDARTLEVHRRWPGDGREAPLAIEPVSPSAVALATDDRRLGFLDLETGAYAVADRYTEHFVSRTGGLGLRGGGKVIDLVPLSDGRSFAAIGLTRQVSIFEGRQEIRSGFLDDELGDATIRAAAIVPTAGGDVLLLGCGDAGLWAISVSALPRTGFESRDPLRLMRAIENAAPSADEPMRARIRALGDHPAAPVLAAVLAAQSAWGEDVGPLLERALRSGDGTLAQRAFRIAGESKRFLGDAAREALSSSEEWMRYYAADHYGHAAVGMHERALDLRPVLADPAPGVVAAAAWSLGRIGSAIAREWLEPLMRDDRARVAFTAVASVLELAGADAAAPIADAIAAGRPLVAIHLAGRRDPKLPALSTALPADFPAKASLEELCAALAGAGVTITDLPLPATTIEGFANRPRWEALAVLLTATSMSVRPDDRGLHVVPAGEAAAWWREWITSGASPVAARPA